MPRNDYEEYYYIDIDKIYTYPNSSVLINKWNLRDAIEVSNKEFELVGMRLLELEITPIEVQSVSDILEIHAYLFQDMYEWAGKFREVNISKSNSAFMPIQAFNQSIIYMNSLIANYYQTAQTQEDVISQLASILDNLNYFHPFREGNGRTQREVVRSLALVKGYKLQIKNDVDDIAYNLYMDGTVYSDIEKLKQLIQLSIQKNE